MHLSVHVDGAILKFVLDIGDQNLNFVHGPTENTREKREGVRLDGFKHRKLLVTGNFLESALLGPG